MPQLAKIEQERHFHDQQAAERLIRIKLGQEDLEFEDREYLEHESWIRPAFAMLGDVAGKAVLDLGCGHGMASVVLARQGAKVTGVDLSPGYISEARARALANGVSGEFLAADAENLPFEDESFDAVWASAILHHLEIPAIARELKRILKPGGVAVFCEPWAGNSLVRLARKYLPYAGKQRTPDEKPLSRDDVAALREAFPDLEFRGYQLFGMVRRLWSVRRSRIWKVLDIMDGMLFRVFPKMQNQARYVVISLRKA